MLDLALKEPATLCAFDLLMIGSLDLRDRSLLERKERLAELLAGRGVTYVQHLEAHDEALFQKAIELDLEGVMAKRADSVYRAGRQAAWRKIKNPPYSRQEALRFHR